MKHSRRVIQLRSYALAFAVALSPAFFQTSYSCARGDTFLLSLELEVSGQDQIANFSTTTRSYAVVTNSSTAVLRVVTKDPNSNATYRWFAGGTAIGPAIAIGTGGGEVTATVPVGESELYVNVQAPEGAFDSYIVDVDRTAPCVDGAACTLAGLPGICEVDTCVPLPEPSFPGIALLAATGTDALSVAWHPATDNLTPPEQMVYEVHVSDQPGFTPDLTTLATAVTGETQAELVGLSAGVEYEVAVVAIDADDFTAEDRRSARTLLLPVQFNPSVPFENAENMDLGEPVVAGTTYTFTPGPSAQMPTVGGILVGPIGPDFYLRTVDSVTVQGSQLVVETSAGALDDAVDQFAIRNSVTLSELAAQGAGAPAGAFLQKGQSAASSRTWANRLLRAEERDGDGFFTASNSGAQFMTKDLSASAEVDVDVTVTFQPTLETDLDWSGTTVNSGRVAATGQLTFDTKAAFDFSVSATPVSEDQTLFTRTYTALYFVGTVPVLQTITLSVDATLEVTAEVTAKANVDATNTATVSAGIVYNPATGSWEPTSNFGFSNTVNVDLSAQAGVTATLELTPKIEVAFYVVAYADFSLTGNLTGMISATDNQDMDSPCFGAELEKADITFTASCGANLGLNLILRKFPLAIDLPFCGPFDYPLFSLPSLAPNPTGGLGDVGDPFVIDAGGADGTNNDLDPSSVLWSVTPTDGQFSQSALGPPEAYLECGASPTYKVYVSGHGVLGELGRRCASVELGCPTTCEQLKQEFIDQWCGGNPVCGNWAFVEAEVTCDSQRIPAANRTVSDKQPTAPGGLGTSASASASWNIPGNPGELEICIGSASIANGRASVSVQAGCEPQEYGCGSGGEIETIWADQIWILPDDPSLIGQPVTILLRGTIETQDVSVGPVGVDNSYAGSRAALTFREWAGVGYSLNNAADCDLTFGQPPPPTCGVGQATVETTTGQRISTYASGVQETVSLPITPTFGESMYARFHVKVATGGVGEYSAAATHEAAWDGLEVFDDAGNPVDYELCSLSGIDWSQPAPPPPP